MSRDIWPTDIGWQPITRTKTAQRPSLEIALPRAASVLAVEQVVIIRFWSMAVAVRSLRLAMAHHLDLGCRRGRKRAPRGSYVEVCTVRLRSLRPTGPL